ncbi:MAG: trypsin-like peptidase domain-containing protein [Acidobacteriota bacterium]
MTQDAASLSEPESTAAAAAATGSENAPIPGLFHLTGSRRGTTETLVAERVRIGSSANTEIHVPADREPSVAPLHATLHRRGLTYQLRSEPGQTVWVNDEPVDEMVLASGDVLQLGEDGPRLRFRIYRHGHPIYRSMAEVLADCVDCAKADGDTRLDQAGIFLKTAPRDLATQTSPRFRWLSAVVLLALIASTASLAFKSARLEERLESQRLRVTGIDELLKKTESEALTPEDLGAVRTALNESLSGTLERLEVLEDRAGASQRAIQAASESVVFLQGAYGFLEPQSRKPLRLVIGPEGVPLTDAAGNPAITIEGDGPVLESMFTGTGFVASDDGLLLTNRHVAVPWEFDEAAVAIAEQGLIPTFFRFVGYLKGVDKPFPVELVATSDDADVAVLRCDTSTRQAPPLALTERVPQPGEEVIVLGYPTGIRALLARTDVNFVNQLASSGDLDFWTVASKLAENGHIAPLATRGIIGQVTSAAIVYDAETTSGGSGGPVINLRGEVVAVNMAILPEFGGSNLGVPVEKARAVLLSVPHGESSSPSADYPVP